MHGAIIRHAPNAAPGATHAAPAENYFGSRGTYKQQTADQTSNVLKIGIVNYGQCPVDALAVN